jgi:hypothetical protein
MAAMSSRRLVFVGPAGMDDRPLCERCETPSHRPLRALDYSDGRRKITCPDCMTFEEDQVAQESFRPNAEEIAVRLEAIGLLSFDTTKAQDARRLAAEASAGLAALADHDQLSMKAVRTMPLVVPAGWRLIHLEEREHWDYPGVDGYLASLVKGADPDLPLLLCTCDWAPGLIHYRVDRQED